LPAVTFSLQYSENADIQLRVIELLVAIAAKLSTSELATVFDHLTRARHLTRYAAVRVAVTKAIATL
jgi:hypothetical protein